MNRFLFACGFAALVWLLLVGSLASAQTPPPGDDNVVLSGHLNCPSVLGSPRVCTFGLHYIEFTAGRTYEIRMESSDFDPRLMLEDLTGNLLAVDTEDFDRLDGCIVFRAPASGRYRLVANAVEPTSDGYYTITVRELPVVMHAEGVLMPRDEPGTSYELALIAGRRYIIDLVSDRSDAFVKLLNADGAIVAYEEEGCPARIVYVPARTGAYRVVAVGANMTANGPFTLTVSGD